MYQKPEYQNKFFLMIKCYIIVKLINKNEMKEYCQILKILNKYEKCEASFTFLSMLVLMNVRLNYITENMS